MAEVIICRSGKSKGGSGSSGSSGSAGFGNSGGTLTTLVFTNNEIWTVPSNIIGNDVSVRIFGGGGGGRSSRETIGTASGGGSGWMNNEILKLSPGEVINITIGDGGLGDHCWGWNGACSPSCTSGGTTSFGQYLVANGGEAGSNNGGGNGGAGGGGLWYKGSGGDGYMFGGGGSTMGYDLAYNHGGNGGPWGGGGGGGGCGGIYGGGGGINSNANFGAASSTGNRSYGCGGKYGGGAAYYNLIWSNTHINNVNMISQNLCFENGVKRSSLGGEYGGNGSFLIGTRWSHNNLAYYLHNAEDGVNTIGSNEVPEEFHGNGAVLNKTVEKLGNSSKGTQIPIIAGGGGGYGGMGGHGAGGGFGGNGGKAYKNDNTTLVNYLRYAYSCPTGGGGYGGDGGDTSVYNNTSYWFGAGGGGGYGKNARGGNGYGDTDDQQRLGAGGGGGYYAPAYDSSSMVATGGAGTIIPNGSKYAYGGNGRWHNSFQNSWFNSTDGLKGVCIVQFYRDL